MNILITGSNGTLGTALVKQVTAAGHEVIAATSVMLDITNKEAVETFITETKPGLVINAAAFNFVDDIEQDEVYEKALKINGLAPGHLAQAAKNNGAKFIHFSTDYVFAGEKPEGYKEDDAPRPISRYGETKLAGEASVLAVGGESYIFRVSKLFGEPGSSASSKESFVDIMLRLAASKPELSIVHEEVGCPTYAKDAAEAVLKYTLDEPKEPGIYHLVNDGKGVTWYEFAEEVFELASITTPRKPVTSAEFPKPAKRPKFAALLNTKLPPLRDRKEALAEYLKTKNTTS